MNNFYDSPADNIQAPALVARRADQVLSVPQVMTQAAGQVYAKELTPTDLLVGAVQGPTPTLVGLSSFGACPTPTGEMFSVGVPVMSPQLYDSYGLPVPGGPPLDGGFRVTRSTGTSKRFITGTHTNKVKRLPYVSSNQAGHAIGITPYGKFAYIDGNGVTHQPPGTRDPVVNRDKFDVLYDGKTIKLDASTNQLYADVLGLDAPGSASDTIPAGPLTAGHAIQIIPGPGPSDPPAVTMIAGAGIDQPASFNWAFSITRYGKETGLSPAQSGVTDGSHGQASIDLPALPTGDAGTAYTLYRKDTATGADGTIQTKFAYTTTAGAVLITDASTGAVEIKSGPETGLWIYTVLAANGNIQKGDEYLFNPSAYVVVGDPPVPIDPRTGAQLHIDVAPDGSYIFTAADTGIFNAVTGAVTFPPGSPLNATVFKTVAAGLSPVAQTYVDSTPNASLGAVYARGKQTINVKTAAYSLAPFSGMTAIPGTTPPQYELSGIGFNPADPLFGNDGLLVRTHEALVINAQNNVVPWLAASATMPAVGAGQTTTKSMPGYSNPMYDLSSLDLYAGDNALGLQVRVDGSSITRRASDGALQSGGSVVVSGRAGLFSSPLAAGGTGPIGWDIQIANGGIDLGGWVAAGTDMFGPNFVFPATGPYMVSFEMSWDGTPIGTGDKILLFLMVNGTQVYGREFDDLSSPYGDEGAPPLSMNKAVNVVAGDVLQITVRNNTSGTIDFTTGGGITIWKI